MAIFGLPVVDHLQAQLGFGLLQVVLRVAEKVVHPLGEGLGLVGDVGVAGVDPVDIALLIKVVRVVIVGVWRGGFPARYSILKVPVCDRLDGRGITGA